MDLVGYDDLVRDAAPLIAGTRLGAAIGRDEQDVPVVIDLAGDEPHLLVVGQSGAGKSYLLNVILAQLLTRLAPSRLQLALIDPKGLMAGQYLTLPHCAVPPVTDVHTPGGALGASSLLVALGNELARRQALFARYGAANLRHFSATHPKDAPPDLLVVIDEAADLALADDADLAAAYRDTVGRIAREGRAAGIHLLMTVQRPTPGALPAAIRAQMSQRAVLKLTDEDESGVALARGDAGAVDLPRFEAIVLQAGERRPARLAFLSDDDDPVIAGASTLMDVLATAARDVQP